MAERDESKPGDFKMLTFEEAKALFEVTRQKTMRNYDLPTLDQLRVGFEFGGAVPIGPEWTKEGFIYDHTTRQLITEPPEDMIANFRVVENFEQSPPPRKKRRRH